ncbi:hypothetical protein BC936DRAFT_136587 [Jimgerdemannia flammicorona]|uniref:Uncharacterized protein n=1 Tax=Jimgerdemannia flammicorona TaxID=994334 RepID=A0A433CZ64_9FUNG|nr:hypothetical protein BC936DRAFT_136587 [Jimgerdemannia flammicorona]
MGYLDAPDHQVYYCHANIVVERELSRAQEALNGPQDELNDKLRRLGDVDDKLAKNYGLNQEWAKLEDQCFELNEGESIRCYCRDLRLKIGGLISSLVMPFFADTRTPSAFLARHTRNPTAITRPHTSGCAFTGNSDPISDEHYAKQLYSEGTRCWNGPDRSVKVRAYLKTHFDVPIPHFSRFPRTRIYRPAIKTPYVSGHLRVRLDHRALLRHGAREVRVRVQAPLSCCVSVGGQRRRQAGGRREELACARGVISMRDTF